MISYLMTSRAKQMGRVGCHADGTGELPYLSPFVSFLHGQGMMYEMVPSAASHTSMASVGTRKMLPSRRYTTLRSESLRCPKASPTPTAKDSLRKPPVHSSVIHTRTPCHPLQIVPDSDRHGARADDRAGWEVEHGDDFPDKERLFGLGQKRVCAVSVDVLLNEPFCRHDDHGQRHKREAEGLVSSRHSTQPGEHARDLEGGVLSDPRHEGAER